jgi:U3 small nucleolar RNA-associated protein 11
MSGASSLRNAVKRVTHKERAQPGDRKKFGLLEKHKDYVERAQDFKKKKKYITTLKKKASERNPDEFYMHMNKSKVVNGQHKEFVNAANLDKDTIDLLKTQDLSYIIYKKSVDDQKIHRLKENIQLIGDVQPKKHTIFVDDEQQLQSFHPVTHFNTLPELIDRNYNRITKDQFDKGIDQDTLPETYVDPEEERMNNRIVPEEQDGQSGSGQKNQKKRKQQQRSESVEELNQRMKRSKKLTNALEELSMQRHLARDKGARTKLTITKTIGKEKKEKEVTLYKWRRERSH